MALTSEVIGSDTGVTCTDTGTLVLTADAGGRAIILRKILLTNLLTAPESVTIYDATSLTDSNRRLIGTFSIPYINESGAFFRNWIWINFKESGYRLEYGLLVKTTTPNGATCIAFTER